MSRFDRDQQASARTCHAGCAAAAGPCRFQRGAFLVPPQIDGPDGASALEVVLKLTTIFRRVAPGPGQVTDVVRGLPFTHLRAAAAAFGALPGLTGSRGETG